MEKREHTESDISNGDDFFDEFYRRASKSLSTSELEAMIAKVLSDAAGREYKAVRHSLII
jgi:hypothetical protein